MNNLESKGEVFLRDQLLRHEFGADEEAWEKMDALLSAHPAPPPPLAMPPAGSKSRLAGKWPVLIGIGLAVWYLLRAEQPASNSFSAAEPENVRMQPTIAGRAHQVAPIGKPETGTKREALPENGDHQTIRAGTGNGQHTPVITTPTRRSSAPAGIGDNGFLQVPATRSAGIPTVVVDRNDSLNRATTPGAGDTIAGMLRLTAPERTVIAALPPCDQVLPTTPWTLPTPVPWTKPARPHRFQLGVVAGGHLAIVPPTIYFKKFAGSPTFGLTAKYALRGRWSVQADLLYRMVPYYLETHFGQGVIAPNGFYNQWAYSGWSNDLSVIDLSLLAKRAFWQNRGNVIMGLQPAFIQPVHANYGEVSSITAPGLGGFSPSFRQGVRRFDLAVTVGAEVRIWRHFWLEARVSQGMFDISHDDFFQNTKTDLITDGQLTLHYYFLSFK